MVSRGFRFSALGSGLNQRPAEPLGQGGVEFRNISTYLSGIMGEPKVNLFHNIRII